MAAAVMATQKCQGTFWRAGGSASEGVSTGVPQVGHSPAAVTERGFQNRSQGSHHGISLACHREPPRPRSRDRQGYPRWLEAPRRSGMMRVLPVAVVAWAYLAENFCQAGCLRRSSLMPGKLPEDVLRLANDFRRRPLPECP